MTVRSWMVIPALGAAAILGALALGYAPLVALAAGALAAALTAAIRAHAGDAPAVLAGSAAGALVGTAGALVAAVAAGHDPARACLAGAAAAWTFTELVQPAPATARPSVALLPACIAAALDPAYAVLVLIAGLRYWRSPQRVMGRWPIVIPGAGALVVLFAVLALRAESGAFATLGHVWTGAAHHAHPAHRDPAALLAGAGDVLGPLAALAAMVGAVLAAVRGRSLAISLSVLALAAGAVATSLYAGAASPALLVLAGLAAGLALTRLAALVEHPAGQACVGAAAGFLLLVAPALALMR